MGFTTSGDVESVLVGFEVERADQPVQLQAEPLLMTFNSVGAQQKIIAYGTYADGTRLVISNALSTQHVSRYQVATVASTRVGIWNCDCGRSRANHYPGSIRHGILPGVSEGCAVAPGRDSPYSRRRHTSATGVPGVTQVTGNGSGFGSAQGTGVVQSGA